MAGDRPSGAHTHNELSGTARTAAQVHTVYGGLHMYPPAPPARTRIPMRNRRSRPAFGATILTVLLNAASIVVAILAAHPTASPQSTGQGAGQVTIHYPLDEKVPRSLNGGRSRYVLEIPERVMVDAFQGYRCGDRMYRRAVVGLLQIPKLTGDLGFVAQHYAEKFMASAWDTKEYVQYGRPAGISRVAYDGVSVFRGVEIEGEFESSVNDRCGSSRGFVHVLALDLGENDIIAIGIAGLGGDPRYGGVPTEDDLRCLLENMIPAG
jgi:hypothetical protein